MLVQYLNTISQDIHLNVFIPFIHPMTYYAKTILHFVEVLCSSLCSIHGHFLFLSSPTLLSPINLQSAQLQLPSEAGLPAPFSSNFRAKQLSKLLFGPDPCVRPCLLDLNLNLTLSAFLAITSTCWIWIFRFDSLVNLCFSDSALSLSLDSLASTVFFGNRASSSPESA